MCVKQIYNYYFFMIQSIKIKQYRQTQSPCCVCCDPMVYFLLDL